MLAQNSCLWKTRSRFRCVGLILLLTCCWGCGQKLYEERLQRTARLYEYLQTVEDNLAPAVWSRADLGLSMKLPKPFGAPLPGPELFKDQTGEEKFGPDPRQTNALGIPLPGLIEGWEASLQSTEGQPDAWIYILSNQDRFQKEAEGGPPPKEFFKDLSNALMGVFRVNVPDGETSQPGKNSRYRLWLPAQNSDRALYVTPKDYVVIRFVPDEEFNTNDLLATLYERREGEVQVAFLVVTRNSTSSQFRQQIDTALETLEVTGQLPPRRRGATTPATGAAPGATPSSRPAQSPGSGF